MGIPKNVDITLTDNCLLCCYYYSPLFFFSLLLLYSWKNKKKLSSILPLTSISSLFLSWLASLFLLYLSHNNYPGGYAFHSLHKLVHTKGMPLITAMLFVTLTLFYCRSYYCSYWSGGSHDRSDKIWRAQSILEVIIMISLM